MIIEALKEQLLANRKPLDPACFFLRRSSCSSSGNLKFAACFPNMFSIIEDAVAKLPRPMRTQMENAVKRQHEENRPLGAHLAIMQCLKPRVRVE